MSAITAATTLEELAGIIANRLRQHGIEVVLSGGALVSLYSSNEYESKDIDFITSAGMREISPALSALGFRKEPGRHFSHPTTDFLVEFPPGPVTVGGEVVKHLQMIETRFGPIPVLSPSDAVKDRLAAFLHWNDRQGLAQAEMIAQRHPVDLADILRWTARESTDPTKRAVVKSTIQAACNSREKRLSEKPAGKRRTAKRRTSSHKP